MYKTEEDKALEAIEVKQSKITDKGEKYRKHVPSKVIDIYDVLVAFDVTNPATQHAVKKLLSAGSRGHKSLMTDLKEAAWSIERAINIEEEYC